MDASVGCSGKPSQLLPFELTEREQALLRGVCDGALIVDLECRVLFVNERYLQQSGYSREEVHALTSMELDAHFDLETARLRFETIRRDGVVAFSTEHVRRDGSRWPVDVSMGFSGEDGHFFAFVRDAARALAEVRGGANADLLTGLPGRPLLLDRIAVATRTCRARGDLLLVCALDLDRFDAINRENGRDTGNEVLREVARRLCHVLHGNDTVARTGGDEFLVLRAGVRDEGAARWHARRLVDTVREPVRVGDDYIRVTASVGVAVFPADDVGAEALLRHAAYAVSLGKLAGGDTFRLFDGRAHSDARQSRRYRDEFEAALDSSALELYLQPRVNLGTGQVVGAEALLRWPHPEDGLLAPGRFLDAIRGTPLEGRLDLWVFARTLDLVSEFRRRGLMQVVSLNISPCSVQDEAFPDALAALLRARGPELAAQVELEILETQNIESLDRVARIMERCRDLGLHFSLDDFGTGYSSLTYFHRLPISVVKLDQGFVRDLLSDPRDLDVVEAMLRMADTLGCPAVAEGVESAEAALMLRQLGCTMAQGYAIARPMPAGELPAWIGQWNRENFCDELQGLSGDTRERQALNVAIFAHRHWLRHFRRTVLGGPAESDAAGALSSEPCGFQAWFDGLGTWAFGGREEFAGLGAAHTGIHHFARDLAEHSATAEVRPEQLDELERRSESFVSALLALQAPGLTP